jgi:hypothetical protein
MLTKQRKVGGSMVFTVPKQYAQPCPAKGSKEEVQMYDVQCDDKGVITYTPVKITY